MRELASHGLNGASEGGDVHVRALLDVGDLFLSDAEGLGHFCLCDFAGATELLKTHFLVQEQLSALRDAAAAGGGEGCDDFIYVTGHGEPTYIYDFNRAVTSGSYPCRELLKVASRL